MRKLLQALLVVNGATCALIGLSHTLFGTVTIIGGGPVNATIDSEMGFGTLLFALYGVLSLWCVRDVESKGAWVDVVASTMFLGGASRFVSIARLGWPHPFYLAMIPLELGLPVVLFVLNRKVRTSAGAVS